MAKKTTITMHICPNVLSILKEIVSGGKYESVAQFIRKAVDEKLEKDKK